MDIELRVKKICVAVLFLFVCRRPLYNARLMNSGAGTPSSPAARVVKLVDTTDLKSVATVKRAYRFDSGLGHQTPIDMPVSTGFPGFRTRRILGHRESKHVVSGNFIGQKATSLLPTNPIYITIHAGTSTITKNGAITYEPQRTDRRTGRQDR